MSDLEVHVLNVGKGDCLIVRLGEDFGVIDCNRTSERRSAAKDKLVDLGAERLRFVCLTHPDMDHYSGLMDVLDHYRGKIDYLYTFPLGEVAVRPARVKKLALQYAELAKAQDSAVVTNASLELIRILTRACHDFLKQGRWEELTGDYSAFSPGGFPGVEFLALQPPRAVKGPFFEALARGRYETESSLKNNELSIAVLIKFAGVAAMLGGDATRSNWTRHRQFQKRSGRDCGAWAVKLPHHGSDRDCDPLTIDEFFSKSGSRPVALISADGKSHPSKEVLEALLANGIEPFCTNFSWHHTVRQLFQDGTLDPQLVRLLNEYGEVDLNQKTVCCGDICISVSASGQTQVATSSRLRCGCKPEVADLLASLAKPLPASPSQPAGGPTRAST